MSMWIVLDFNTVASHLDLGKFKKNVTVQYFYPHALNMEYFYLNLSLKGVFWYPFIGCQIWRKSNDK